MMHDWRRDDCEICGARSTGYYDITMTGIGHFLFHCANEEHKAEVFRRGQAIDAKRNKDYEERKEWMQNYTQLPMEEV